MALPWLLVALPAGALVDRVDPARAMAAANLARAVVAAALTVAIGTDRVGIPLLCAVGFAFTTAETFADSAAQSLLVRIVPSGQLERANGRFVSSENLGLDMIGPLLAGALFGFASWLPFTVSAVAFAVTALFMLTLTGQGQHDDPAVAGDLSAAVSSGPTAVRPSIGAGFRAVFSDVGLRVLVITVAVMAGAIAAAEGVLVIYSASSLHLPAVLYPTLLAAYSVGLLISATLVGRLARRVRPGSVMLGSIAAIGVTLVVLGLAPVPVVAWCCFLLMGGAAGMWNILSATRRQRRTPRNMVGRVSSTFRAIGWGALPLGTVLGGLGGERWSVPTVFVLAGAVVLLLACVMGRFLVRADPSGARTLTSGPTTEPDGRKSAPVR